MEIFINYLKDNKLKIFISFLAFLAVVFFFYIFFFINPQEDSKLNAFANANVNDMSLSSSNNEEGWNKYELIDLKVPQENLNFYKLNKDSMNILLLGLDTREEDFSGRSDSILLLSLNKNKDNVRLLNIPRDSYVNIPKKGYDKINHSFAYGGADLTRQTVENLLGVEISNTVTINFKSFERVIDILGGVDVNVAFDFTEQLSDGNYFNFIEGDMTLTGEQALAYARMRKMDAEGDFGRGKRQQEIIESLINESKNLSNVLKIKKLYDEISNNVISDLSVTEILSLFNYTNNLSNIEKSQLLGNPAMINGVSYVELDSLHLESEILNLHNFLD